MLRFSPSLLCPSFFSAKPHAINRVPTNPHSHSTNALPTLSKNAGRNLCGGCVANRPLIRTKTNNNCSVTESDSVGPSGIGPLGLKIGNKMSTDAGSIGGWGGDEAPISLSSPVQRDAPAASLPVIRGHKIVVSKQTADTLLWAVPTFFTTAGLLSNDVGLWYAIRFYYYFI